MLPGEITRATDEGLIVCWQTPSYQVIKGELESGYFIRSLVTGHCIRLFKSNGKSLNGAESDFFIRGAAQL